jgi:hypothetical protein
VDLVKMDSRLAAITWRLLSIEIEYGSLSRHGNNRQQRSAYAKRSLGHETSRPQVRIPRQ